MFNFRLITNYFKLTMNKLWYESIVADPGFGYGGVAGYQNTPCRDHAPLIGVSLNFGCVQHSVLHIELQNTKFTKHEFLVQSHNMGCSDTPEI